MEGQYSNCRNLVFAILLQAAEDAARNVATLPEHTKEESKRKEEAWTQRRKARAWINSKKDGFMSYIYYCELVDLAPSMMRSIITKKRANNGTGN